MPTHTRIGARHLRDVIQHDAQPPSGAVDHPLAFETLMCSHVTGTRNSYVASLKSRAAA